MTITPDDPGMRDDDDMNDLVSITFRDPPSEDDDSSYLIMPLESLQSSPWPPDEKDDVD